MHNFLSLSVVHAEYFYSVGGHFGHKIKHWNPNVLGAVNFLSLFNGFMLFNIQYLCFFLQKAFVFVKKNSSRGAIVLYVDSRKSSVATNILRDLAIGSGLNFVNDLWTGGLISNFRETVYNYTRKKIFKKFMKFNKRYGVKNLDFLPETVIVASESYAPFCISECNISLIPTIGIVDSNIKIFESTYPVFFNDDSIFTVRVLFYLFIANYWFGRADFALKYLGISVSFLLLEFKNYFLNQSKLLILNKKIKNWLKQTHAHQIILPTTLYFLFSFKV